MLRQMDADYSGTIDRYEFLAYMLVHMNKVDRSEVAKIDRLYDRLCATYESDAPGGRCKPGEMDIHTLLSRRASRSSDVADAERRSSSVESRGRSPTSKKSLREPLLPDAEA